MFKGVWEITAPGCHGWAGLGNEGVGEHVRTRFHLGLKTAGEIADLEIRTERRKLVSSAGPAFLRANSSKYDPAV
jgi:hypothetical protein